MDLYINYLSESQVQGLQNSISELMTYPLILTPYSVATIDGFFAKTSKAKGMNYLIGKENEIKLSQKTVPRHKMGIQTST